MILYKYLFTRFIIGVIVSLLVLVSIEVFFSFTAELKYLDVGNYSFMSIVKYIILTIPKSILIMFPYAVLIGAMLSLGAMASDMEFISMHSAGISIAKIIIIIMTQAFILSIVFYTISDSFVPKFTSHAEYIKNTALNKKVIFNHNGVWFKDKNTFIKINEIYSDHNLKGIILYKYNDNNSISNTCNTSLNTSCYKGRKWTLPVQGVSKTDLRVSYNGNNDYKNFNVSTNASGDTAVSYTHLTLPTKA